MVQVENNWDIIWPQCTFKVKWKTLQEDYQIIATLCVGMQFWKGSNEEDDVTEILPVTRGNTQKDKNDDIREKLGQVIEYKESDFVGLFMCNIVRNNALVSKMKESYGCRNFRRGREKPRISRMEGV